MMSRSDIIIFLNADNEKDIFNQFIDNPSLPSKFDELLLKLIDTPIKNFIKEVINNHKDYSLTSRDICQFSNFYSGTIDLCQHLKYSGNKGYTYVEVGKFLLKGHRKDAALRKYGENHSKLAFDLGLTIIQKERPHRVYLSQCGNSLLAFEKPLQTKILTRLILKMKLIQYIIHSTSKGTFNFNKELSFLSNNTINRRLPNIKFLLNYLKENSEHDLSFLLDDIV